MSDESGDVTDEEPIRLFGDPRSSLIERGADRRAGGPVGSPRLTPPLADGPRYDTTPTIHPSSGDGDGFALLLRVVGVMVFGVTVLTSTLILYNAKNVGAFRNPWDSTRVAIGLAVLAVGLVQSVILLGLARITTSLGALHRVRSREFDARDHYL